MYVYNIYAIIRSLPIRPPPFNSLEFFSSIVMNFENVDCYFLLLS